MVMNNGIVIMKILRGGLKNESVNSVFIFYIVNTISFSETLLSL